MLKAGCHSCFGKIEGEKLVVLSSVLAGRIDSVAASALVLAKASRESAEKPRIVVTERGSMSFSAGEILDDRFCSEIRQDGQIVCTSFL